MILTLFLYSNPTKMESKHADLQVNQKQIRAIIIYPRPRGTGAFQIKGMMENEIEKQNAKAKEKSSEFQQKKLRKRRIKIMDFISEYPTLIFMLISLVFIVIFVLILPCLLYLYFESTRIE